MWCFDSPTPSWARLVNLTYEIKLVKLTYEIKGSEFYGFDSKKRIRIHILNNQTKTSHYVDYVDTTYSTLQEGFLTLKLAAIIYHYQDHKCEASSVKGISNQNFPYTHSVPNMRSSLIWTT